MSVKSTIQLDRASAQNRYANLVVQSGNPLYFILKVISNWPDDYLEEQLEELNDKAAGGEGFENYMIVEEEDE